MSDIAEALTVAELDQACEKLLAKKQELEAASEVVTNLQAEYTGLELKVLAHLEMFGKDRYQAASGMLSVVNKFSYKIPRTTEDREKFFQYLKEKGHYDSLISVNSQTLNAYCKEEMEAAALSGNIDFSLPGISEPTHYQRIQVRKK